MKEFTHKMVVHSFIKVSFKCWRSLSKKYEILWRKLKRTLFRWIGHVLCIFRSIMERGAMTDSNLALDMCILSTFKEIINLSVKERHAYKCESRVG